MHNSIRRSLGLLLVLILAFLPYKVHAQTSTATYSTTITYQNIGSDTAHVTLLFYPEDSNSPISISRPDLAVGASATVSVGSLGSSTGFRGSAVVKADMQLAVTMTQIPNNSDIKSRPMASGFIQGSSEIWFPFALKETPGTIISVQNVDQKPVNLKLTFYSTNGTVTINKNNVAVGSAAYFNLDTMDELSVGAYDVYVKATRTGSDDIGKIAGLQINQTSSAEGTYATESLSQAGKKIYMPAAMCYGVSGFSTSYYIYNTSLTESTTVTVLYNSGKKGTLTLSPNYGTWYHACMPSGTQSGYNGSAVITSNNTNIIAWGHIKNNGLIASFTGQTVGSNVLAVPYVVYSASKYTNSTRQRTMIYIQNLGSSLAKGAVKVKYYDKNGNLVGTHSLGSMGNGARIESNPTSIGSAGSEFGYYSDGTSGGSAVIEAPAGSNIMAVAWVHWNPSKDLYRGEAYNAIPIMLAP